MFATIDTVFTDCDAFDTKHGRRIHPDDAGLGDASSAKRPLGDCTRPQGRRLFWSLTLAPPLSWNSLLQGLEYVEARS